MPSATCRWLSIGDWDAGNDDIAITCGARLSLSLCYFLTCWQLSVADRDEGRVFGTSVKCLRGFDLTGFLKHAPGWCTPKQKLRTRSRTRKR